MVITVGKALVHGAFLLAGVGVGIKLLLDHHRIDDEYKFNERLTSLEKAVNDLIEALDDFREHTPSLREFELMRKDVREKLTQLTELLKEE